MEKNSLRWPKWIEYFFWSLYLLFFLLIGCSKSSDSTGNYSDIPFFTGTWKSPCYVNEAYLNLQSEYVFNEKEHSLEETSYIYADTTCQLKIGKLERSTVYTSSNIRGTSNDPNSSNTAAGSFSVVDLDLKQIMIKITPLNSGQLTLWNNTNFCGFNNWYLNAPTYISGKTCNGYTYPELDSTDYTTARYYFSNATVNDQIINKESMFFGVLDGSLDGLSLANRKTKFKTSIPLVIKN